MQDKDNSYTSINSVSFGKGSDTTTQAMSQSTSVNASEEKENTKEIKSSAVTGFGRSSEFTSTRPTPNAKEIHTKKSLKEFLSYDEEVSLGAALGDKDKVPSPIKKMPKGIGFLWRAIFGGINFKEKKLHPKASAGVDRVMILIICVLVCIGSVMVFSASYAFAETRYGDSLHFVKKQITFVLIGLVAMFVTASFTPAFYKMLSRGFFGVSLVLLVLVLIMGFAGNGAQRWIAIGPISFQPSEIAKMALVLILAWYYSVFEDKITNYSNKRIAFFYGIVYPFLFIGITAGLVMLEKHLSCLIILGCIGMLIMYASGSETKMLGVIFWCGIAAVAILAIAIPYTRRRLVIWLDPSKDSQGGGWQTLQGLNAIGSGGFFGLGLGNSRMKYSYVSEPANDFIFTITCEELGFVGAAAIVAIFALFIWRGYHIAKTNRDTFARITAFGITSQIAIQVLLNIAVVTNTFPNTGIALPFFSYGGTSLVMLFAEMGILLSVSRTSHLKYR